MRKSLAILLLPIFICAFIANNFAAAQAQDACKNNSKQCWQPQLLELTNQIKRAAAPSVTAPSWTVPVVATPSAPRVAGQAITVTYTVQTLGNVSASLDDFANLANETLNSSRGWAQMGLRFTRVSSGGQFNLILAEPAQVAAASTGCDSYYSCRVGNSVLINEARWNGATDAWNQYGGSLRDYRHMVVNHETGHWLGHGHASCPAAGQPAPVMQQQSISLQGCTANPWPLAGELHSARYGI